MACVMCKLDTFDKDENPREKSFLAGVVFMKLVDTPLARKQLIDGLCRHHAPMLARAVKPGVVNVFLASLFGHAPG